MHEFVPPQRVIPLFENKRFAIVNSYPELDQGSAGPVAFFVAGPNGGGRRGSNAPNTRGPIIMAARGLPFCLRHGPALVGVDTQSAVGH